MIIINFTHPITPAQQTQVESQIGRSLAAVHTIPTQLDNGRPFAQQIEALINGVPLTPDQWQTTPILINPPAYAPAVAVLLAQLHGRTGHFPTIIRIRPVPNTTPAQFEVAELINLQTERDAARHNRQS
ncbi:MAG: CRISPR-associated protein Csx15 [Candidatus Promineifilaceae bacterium]